MLFRELDLPRPRSEVFRYLADFSTVEQWDPGVARAEKRTPGAPRVGSIFDVVLALGPRRVPVAYAIRQLAPHLIELHGEGAGFRVVDRIVLEERGAQGSRITYSLKMYLPRSSRALRPLLERWAGRMGDRAMAGLARALADDGVRQADRSTQLADRLLLPGAARFTRAGYRAMPTRGLTRYLDGQRVGITGATAGLGLAAAQLLARLGASLVLVGRDEGGLDRARRSIIDFAGDTPIECVAADLSSLEQCRGVSDRLLAAGRPLDVWINNAGALHAEREVTSEGFERALAINVLAPAFFTWHLAPHLAQRGGRIINVVSGGLYLQGVDLDDLGFEKRAYDGAKAYAQAKRALLTLSQQWAKHPRFRGAAVHAMHPGWADTPGVARSLPAFQRIMRPFLRDARMGADTMVWLASHPDLDASRSGLFWFDRVARPATLLRGTGMDEAAARRLETTVLAMLGEGGDGSVQRRAAVPPLRSGRDGKSLSGQPLGSA